MRLWKILVSVSAGTANDMQIIPTITTITSGAWRSKLAEVKRLNLKEICLFPTCLNFEERKELYSLLEETGAKTVPFVHLRSDMTLQELEYFIEKYGTKLFNIHTKREFAPLADYGRYKKLIYVENTYEPLDEKEISEFGGICLDLAHLENDRKSRPEIYKHNIEVLDKYHCGCNHIAPAKDFPFINEIGEDFKRHPHFFNNLSEFDYLKDYSGAYFGEIAALEIENTIKEQLQVKKYLDEKIR